MNYSVSIIIPVFNSEKYLRKCIDSVVNQSYKNLELILVNDGSSDGSGRICEEYVSKHNFIKVFHRKNSGVSATRNFGIIKSSGDYICFIDSDDYVEECMVERLLNLSKENYYDLIISGIYFERIDGESWDNTIREFEVQENEKIKEILKELFMSYLLYNPVGKLYKAEVIKENGIRFIDSVAFGEDPIFNCEIFKNINSVGCINESFYNYVKHGETSLSNRFDISKYDSNKLMHKEIQNLLEYYNVYTEDIKAELEWRYSKEIIDMIFTITRAENISTKIKVDFLKVLFADNRFTVLESYINDVNWLLKNLIKRKCSVEIVLYFNIRKLFRK